MRILEKIAYFKQESVGASMVEFALILPLLVTISLGIYETTNYILLSQKLNEIDKIVSIEEKAVGEKAGMIKFSVAKDTINHVISQNDNRSAFHEVEMTFLDHFQSQLPKMIKIDVEGFEWNVLNGAKQLLADPNLDVILIEINGSGKYFDVDDNSLHLLLTESGFQPYSYDPFNRKLSQLQTYGNLNTIYIRNEALVKDRLINAESFITMGISI